MLADPIERRPHGGRRAEEERSRDPVNHYVGIGRELRVVRRATVAVCRVRHVLLNQRTGTFYLDRLRHAMQEQQRAKPEADENALGQVAEDDEKEGRQQYQGVAARSADERHELVLLGHVPRDDREHGRERGERNVASQRSRREHENQ